MASKASEFRALTSRGEEITLPYSGLKVNIRPVSVTSLVRRGVVPQELLTEAMQGFPEVVRLEKSNKARDAKRFAELMIQADNYAFAILSEMLLEPRLSDDPNDEECITLNDFAEGDVPFLLELSNVPVKEWKRFLSEQDERIRALGNNEEPENTSE